MLQTQSKKENILEAATVFFSEKGFRDTSMGKIARGSGVADGTIFYHFKTKEELFLAVLEKFKDEVVKEFEEYFVEQDLKTAWP